MPRFYFHLQAPDEHFRDAAGWEVGDLSAAHSRAVMLAKRVMMCGGLAHIPPDMSRWTVKIEDEVQRSVMTVILPVNFDHRKSNVQITNGAHALRQRVASAWGLTPSYQAGVRLVATDDKRSHFG
jgi:hypothetical protein